MLLAIVDLTIVGGKASSRGALQETQTLTVTPTLTPTLEPNPNQEHLRNLYITATVSSQARTTEVTKLQESLQLKTVSSAASKFSALRPRLVPGANPGHGAACATPLQRLFAGGAAAGAAAGAASSAAEGILAYTGAAAGAAAGTAEPPTVPRMPQPPPDPRSPAADGGSGRASPAPRRKTRLSGGNGGGGGGASGGEPPSLGMFPPLSMGPTAVSSMTMAAQHAIDDVSESGLATTRFVTVPQGVQRGGAQSAQSAAAAPPSAAATPRRGTPPRPGADRSSEERPPSNNGRPPSNNGRPPRRSMVGAPVAADGHAEDFSSKAAVPSHLPKI